MGEPAFWSRWGMRFPAKWRISPWKAVKPRHAVHLFVAPCTIRLSTKGHAVVRIFSGEFSGQRCFTGVFSGRAIFTKRHQAYRGRKDQKERSLGMVHFDGRSIFVLRTASQSSSGETKQPKRESGRNTQSVSRPLPLPGSGKRSAPYASSLPSATLRPL